MKPLCFFDLETTGTDKSNDRIVEIAMAKVDAGKIIARFYKLVNPQMPIPEAAYTIHGITDDKVKYAPVFKTIARPVLEFMEGCDFAGYNSNSFDIPMLYMELQRSGVDACFDGIHFIDACNIFRRKEERTLTAAVKFYTGYEHDNAHSAMDDVEATIKVFYSQLNRYTDLNELSTGDLSLYCNYDKPRADLSGNFQIDADGDFIFSFGKHKGKKAKDNKDYLGWMLGQDFLPDTKTIIKSILKT